MSDLEPEASRRPTIRQRVRIWVVKRPTGWFLGLGGWFLAAVFFLFWLFDVGDGPINGERVGTAGEWTSGIATAGALGVSLYVLGRDRHEREMEKRRAANRREMERIAGDFLIESELQDEAKTHIPVRGSWQRVPSKLDDVSDQERARYAVEFEIYNGLTRPLSDLRVALLFTGDWTSEDYETREYPGSVRISDGRILAPGQMFTFGGTGDPALFDLATERVENGAHMSAKWRIGDFDYDWSNFGPSGNTYLSVTSRKRQERRSSDS